MIGMDLSSESAFNCSISSSPLTCGIWMSMTINSGRKARARSTASRPSRTGSASKPWARSRSQNSFRLSSLSSTTRIFWPTGALVEDAPRSHKSARPGSFGALGFGLDAGRGGAGAAAAGADRAQRRGPSGTAGRAEGAGGGARLPRGARARPPRLRRGARRRARRPRRGAAEAGGMTGRPLLVTDCDEVLLHMVSHFAEWVAEAHDLSFDLSAPGFRDALRGPDGQPVGAERVWPLLDQFFAGEMHRQNVVPGAVEALAEISAHADVVILTNIGDEYEAGRVEQLERFDIRRRVLCNRGGKGRPVLELVEAAGPT